MQVPFRFFVASSFIAIAASAFAQTDTSLPQRIEITGTPEALAAARVVIERRESDQRFSLPNGRRLEVDAYGETLQLRYRNRRLAAHHDGQGAFVSGDGQLRVEFRLDASGDPTGLRMDMPANWY